MSFWGTQQNNNIQRTSRAAGSSTNNNTRVVFGVPVVNNNYENELSRQQIEYFKKMQLDFKKMESDFIDLKRQNDMLKIEIQKIKTGTAIEELETRVKMLEESYSSVCGELSIAMGIKF